MSLDGGINLGVTSVHMVLNTMETDEIIFRENAARRATDLDRDPEKGPTCG